MKIASPETLVIASLGVALIPLLISVATCYLKFTIVLSILRSGFGTQQAPSSSLIMALSLVMSLVVMQPVVMATVDRLSGVSVDQLMAEPLTAVAERARDVVQPWRTFLERHVGTRELKLFREISNEPPLPEAGVDELRSRSGLVSIVAAFVLSEIKRGFTIAFYLLIPFFVIDLIVANLLIGMGLTMMSPVIVSLPLKLLLFVSADGWLLIAQSLVQSYR